MDESNERSRRARVFISCGQTKDSGELETAHKIRDRLKELGFDPYIAVDEQTLRGLKENIFPQLQDSARPHTRIPSYLDMAAKPATSRMWTPSGII